LFTPTMLLGLVLTAAGVALVTVTASSRSVTIR
jgi:hypothetical protein